MASKLLTSMLLLVSLVTASHISPAPHRLGRRDIDPSLLYPAYNISVPVDHFHNDSKYAPHSNAFFNLSYYFDATYYKPGGPVIVLQGGETDAASRLPYMQTGILAKLANATGGISVILEHRYFGVSFPTPDLKTKSYRFLTTDQAMADQVYFAQHIVFPGMEHMNLTAPGTPYLAYGGSYAGAFVAFLRKLYPDVYWGAISSSGVTEAIWDYWQYYEPVREYGPPACILALQRLTNVADTVLKTGSAFQIRELKRVFGLENVTHNDDFMNTLSFGVGYWQERNWDPAVNDPTFYEYCGNISSIVVQYPATQKLSPTVTSLIIAGGWGSEASTLTNQMLNYIGWMQANVVSECTGVPQDTCFGTHNFTNYQGYDLTDKSLSNWDLLSWPYMYCTEWGFLQTGSGVPKNQLPLISRFITLAYESLICVGAFNITTPPNTQAINQYGGFNISYPRLAIIGGEADPWRPSTPLATLPEPDRLNSTSTTDQPVILIQGAVHHWDENGLFPNETTATLPPKPVAMAQQQEETFVKAWMKEWAAYCKAHKGACTINP